MLSQRKQATARCMSDEFPFEWKPAAIPNPMGGGWAVTLRRHDRGGPVGPDGKYTHFEYSEPIAIYKNEKTATKLAAELTELRDREEVVALF